MPALTPSSGRSWRALLLLLPPVIGGILIYAGAGVDPGLIRGASQWETLRVPERNDRLLMASERVAEGRLSGPEDLAYAAGERVLYTGCADGWIRRVALDGSAVTDWAFVGGRPLGVAIGPAGELVVAESDKGLMRIHKDKRVEVLADEAEGVPFLLTDGVDVASNGIIYFTDASYKHRFKDFIWDILLGRPHGRLMSFDPSINQTRVLARHLYFANGVALSPDQNFLVFCETPARRCRKYHTQGEKKGTVEDFIDNLPGFPDNVRYDGDGHFWIALSSGRTLSWYLTMKYPSLRKVLLTLGRYIAPPHPRICNSGVLAVDVAGKPVALYRDPSLSLVSAGVRIDNHLYYGSLVESYIGRLDLSKHAAS